MSLVPEQIVWTLTAIQVTLAILGMLWTFQIGKKNSDPEIWSNGFDAGYQQGASVCAEGIESAYERGRRAGYVKGLAETMTVAQPVEPRPAGGYPL